MTARNYLSEIRSIQTELRICREQASNCHISYSSLTGIDYSKDRIQSSPKNALEEAAWKMLAQEEKLAQDVERLTAELNKRLQLIRNMKIKRYSDFLYLYYYDHKSLKTISHETGYKIGTLKNIHTESLKEFESEYSACDL